MGRVAFISDLHANLVALDAVLADIDALGVDQIVCLGDIVDLGPQPVEVLERLEARAVRCIRGNHDTLHEHPAHPMLLEIEAWTQDRIGAERLAALAALPTEIEVELGGLRVLGVHGSPHADTDQILAETPRETLAPWLDPRTFDVLVGGHTHVQLLRRLDERVLVNAGSVGMPFAAALLPGGGAPQVLPWCEYAVIGAAAGALSVDLRRVPLDVRAYAASVRACAFPDAEAWIGHWPPP